MFLMLETCKQVDERSKTDVYCKAALITEKLKGLASKVVGVGQG